VSSVMAVFDFHGDSEELAAQYDVAIHKVVAVSSARPVVHHAVPREYGFMVVDVWNSEDALRSFEQNENSAPRCATPACRSRRCASTPCTFSAGR
jgi:hypothetical protein